MSSQHRNDLQEEGSRLPSDPRFTEEELLILKAKRRKEQAITAQALVSAFVTGLFGVFAAGLLWQGRKGPGVAFSVQGQAGPTGPTK